MKPFITHSGLVAPMDRVNVDTDQMVPKQFLKALTREGFGRIRRTDRSAFGRHGAEPDDHGFEGGQDRRARHW